MPRRLLIGLIIFASLSAVGFSFKNLEARWLWERYPFVPPALLLFAFLIIRRIWQWERREEVEKYRALLDNTQTDRQTAWALIHSLSMREKEVLRAMAAGMNNRQIAAALFIEESTVKSHINRIYKMMNVRSRREALALLNQLNLISLNMPGSGPGEVLEPPSA